MIKLTLCCNLGSALSKGEELVLNLKLTNTASPRQRTWGTTRPRGTSAWSLPAVTTWQKVPRGRIHTIIRSAALSLLGRIGGGDSACSAFGHSCSIKLIRMYVSTSSSLTSGSPKGGSFSARSMFQLKIMLTF